MPGPPRPHHLRRRLPGRPNAPSGWADPRTRDRRAGARARRCIRHGVRRPRCRGLWPGCCRLSDEAGTAGTPRSDDRAADPSALDDRIAVTARGQIRLIPIGDVRVALADDEGACVLTPDGRYHVRQPLHELERRLLSRGFLRVHRGYLVNLNYVSSMQGFFNGTYLLKLSGLGDLTVPVSRRHAADLKSAIRL